MNEDEKELIKNLDLLMNMDLIQNESDWETVQNLDEVDETPKEVDLKLDEQEE